MNRLSSSLVIAACAAMSVFAAARATADVGPKLHIRLQDLAGPAQTMVPITFTVELSAPQGATVKGFALSGDRWIGIVSDAPPDSIVIPPGSARRIRVTATPQDPTIPFEVHCTVKGQPVIKILDLSRAHWDLLTRPNGVVTIADTDAPAPFGPAASLVRPEPAPLRARRAGLKPVRDRSQAGGFGVQGSHNVTVHGRMVYLRDDNLTCGVDGITVRVYDEDWDFDEYLGATSTDANGYFSKTVSCSEGEPDLYLELETSSSAVTVEDGSIFEDNYVWTTHVEENYTSSDLNFGTFSTGNSSLRPALHIYSNVMKGWRWWGNHQPEYPSAVDVQWPDGVWPHYDGELHIPNWVNGTPYHWKTDTHLHEYGHHLMDQFMATDDPDYQNGYCDNGPNGAGHCLWCQETGHDATGEGWPNWFSDVVTRSYPADYGYASNFTRSQENLGACMDSDGNPCACSPYWTEGFFGALCRDLEDNTPNEQDPAAAGGIWRDRLALGANAVIAVMRYQQSLTPTSFISDFQSANPAMDKEKFWETCANAGYALFDGTAPSQPTNFHSTDHAISVSEPDNTIAMSWTRSADNLSGVAGYSILVGAGPSLPNTTQDVADVTSWTSGQLAIGTYYLSIRPQDRAGNWSSGYTTAGPYIIRAPYPANFTDNTPAGWDESIVPRSDASATTNNCPVTPFLSGNQVDTYWNVAGINNSEQTSTANCKVRAMLDGAPLDSVTFGFIAAGSAFQTRNHGPRHVRGGRHTLEAWLDGSEQNAEPNENDNRHGKQWVWTPLSMGPSVKYSRSAPPLKDGGWNSFTVPIGFTKFFNCDGLTFSHVNRGETFYWSAVSAFASDNDDDEDLMLHLHSDGSEDGFTDGIEFATRSAGFLDALITNHRVNSSTSWDVGVVNYNGGTSNYIARQALGGDAAVGDSFVVAFGDSMMLAIKELNVDLGNVGKLAVEVTTDSTLAPITVLWLDETFNFGSLLDYDAKATTASNGRITLSFTVASTGYNGLVFYRNPRDGVGPQNFTVRIYKKTPDAAPVTPAGWHAALTPRGASDGAPGSVPLPFFLPGDASNTWFNVAVKNASDVFMPSIYAQLTFDETVLGGPVLFSVGANATAVANNTLPKVLPGGRHVVTMTLDPNGSQAELDESNNRYGEQYVWSPAALALGVPQWRKGTNGGPLAGWDACDPAAVLDFDCDGVRSLAFTPAMGHAWAGFAVTPRPGHDVDLRLHNLAGSAKTGFDEPLELSGWSTDATDFILTNFHATGYRALDAGIVRSSDDTSSYVAEIVGSTLHSTVVGTFGPYTLGNGQLLELHEFHLPVGHYTVGLINNAGLVDWGLAVYSPERPYQNRTAGLDVAAQWLNGPGLGESITFNVAQTGDYCFAVWKTGAGEVTKSGTFYLDLNVNSLAVEGDRETGLLALSSIYPNPVAESATLSFELPTASEVTLEIFDVRGALVKTVAKGAWSAGRHRSTWDGTDASGRPAPGGMYLARLSAGGHQAQRKLVKLR